MWRNVANFTIEVDSARGQAKETLIDGRFVPYDMAEVHAPSIEDTYPGVPKLFNLLERLELVFRRGWWCPTRRPLHGIIHQDAAQRISKAALCCAVGADLELFEADLCRLVLYSHAPEPDDHSDPPRTLAFNTAYASGEAMVSRTLRPRSMRIDYPFVKGAPVRATLTVIHPPGAPGDPMPTSRYEGPPRRARSRSSDRSDSGHPHRRTRGPRGPRYTPWGTENWRAPSPSRGSSPASRSETESEAPGPLPIQNQLNYWPGHNDVMILQGPDKVQYPCINAPEQLHSPGMQDFFMERERAELQLYVTRSCMDIHVSSASNGLQRDAASDVWLQLQDLGPPWSGKQVALYTGIISGVSFQGAGLGNDPVERAHAARIALCARAHTEAGLERAPEAVTRVREHMARNPRVMVAHPSAQPAVAETVVPRSKTRFGPTFCDPEIITIDEAPRESRGRASDRRRSPEARAHSAHSARTSRSPSVSRSEVGRRESSMTYAAEGHPLFAQVRLADGKSFQELCRQWNNNRCQHPVSRDRFLCPNGRLHVCAICLGPHPHLECPIGFEARQRTPSLAEIYAAGLKAPTSLRARTEADRALNLGSGGGAGPPPPPGPPSSHFSHPSYIAPGATPWPGASSSAAAMPTAQPAAATQRIVVLNTSNTNKMGQPLHQLDRR
jgi:hypothetical protein